MSIDLDLWYSRCSETSFTRANRLADEAKARQQATCDAWWMDAALWQEPGLHHSKVEMMALLSILLGCPKTIENAMKEMARTELEETRAIIRELFHEARDNGSGHGLSEEEAIDSEHEYPLRLPGRYSGDRYSLRPLRDILATRGETVVTLDFGNGQSMRQTVRLRKSA